MARAKAQHEHGQGARGVRQYRYSKEKDALLRRMRKIEGQARGVQRMIEEDRYCPDIIQQLTALSHAASEVSLLVLRDHWRWLSLPPAPSPGARLVEDLRREGVERVHLLGFPHQARYGDRLRPLDTWYLGRLGIDRLVDHGADPLSAEAGAERATRPRQALIVNGHSLPDGRLTLQQRARLAQRYRVLAWPGSPQGTRADALSRAAGPAIAP